MPELANLNLRQLLDELDRAVDVCRHDVLREAPLPILLRDVEWANRLAAEVVERVEVEYEVERADVAAEVEQ